MSDFQASSSAQGAAFDGQCRLVLDRLGLKHTPPFVIRELGVEVDAAAITAEGYELWVEFKGSFLSERPGLRRTDTLKKAIANGALIRTLEQPRPYIVLTSHMPADGSAGEAMLHAAYGAGFLDFVCCIYDPQGVARFAEWLADGAA